MILYSRWLSLPLHVRGKIAADFDIPKLRSTHVINNEVADDGYDINMIENALTKEAMQRFIPSQEEDLNVLFNLLVDKAEGKLPEPIVIPPLPPLPPEPIITVLPEAEVKQFNKEYEERTGLKAPVKDKSNAKRKKGSKK